jgi:hypothetical protein
LRNFVLDVLLGMMCGHQFCLRLLVLRAHPAFIAGPVIWSSVTSVGSLPPWTIATSMALVHDMQVPSSIPERTIDRPAILTMPLGTGCSTIA